MPTEPACPDDARAARGAEHGMSTAVARPLKLLQLVHGYPPAVGGVEFAVRDVCERLVARHGVDVTVLTTNAYTNANFRDGSLPTIPIVRGEVQNGVRVHRFPVVTAWAKPLRVLQRAAYTLRLPGSGRLRTWYQGPISPAMRRAVAHFDADVVLAASFPLNLLHYAFTTGPRARPVVLQGSIHVNDPWGYDRKNLIQLSRRAFATVAHTGPERDWLLRRGVPEGQVVVIPEGIDPDGLVPRPNAFRRQHRIAAEALLVAFVGQQGSHKGIDLLLSVWPRLLRGVADGWLAIGGARTPYSATIQSLVRRLPPSARDRVLLLDDLPAQDKADLIGDCDIFASPSAHESFGLTTLEAWACGKPVVVGDGAAQRWVVEDGRSGLTVPPGDGERLLEALVRLSRDAALRQSLGEAGRQRLRDRFTLDVVVAEYEKLLRRAAAS